ncbi:MAG TPA: hypothetical protein ENN67_01550 [Firmicutes bacterium]|nr:hypothetical protein [Bacillota bacterium]
MFLHQNRLVEIETEFCDAIDKARELRARLTNADETDTALIKLELAVLSVEIRALKEKAAFFLKLGERYEMARFHRDFIDELRRENPKLAEKIIRRLDKKWEKKKSVKKKK